MDDLDARVFFCPGIAERRAAVRAAVVDEEYLQVRIALPHNALHTGVEIALDLIDRDNNGDGGHEGAPFVMGKVSGGGDGLDPSGLLRGQLP